jgi:hypothetical protein
MNLLINLRGWGCHSTFYRSLVLLVLLGLCFSLSNDWLPSSSKRHSSCRSCIIDFINQFWTTFEPFGAFNFNKTFLGLISGLRLLFYFKILQLLTDWRFTPWWSLGSYIRFKCFPFSMQKILHHAGPFENLFIFG